MFRFTKLRIAHVLAVMGLVVGGAFFTTMGDAQARPNQFQATNMIVFGEPDNLLPGAATLTRTKRDISYRIYTNGLNAGHAYTVWIVIFNKPENCDGMCGGPDLSNPEVQGSIVYGGGYIAGANGNGNFHGSLKEGNPPAGMEVNVPAGTVNGLKNSMKADIHFVVRTHGEPVAFG